jgi:hypothetical protein
MFAQRIWIGRVRRDGEVSEMVMPKFPLESCRFGNAFFEFDAGRYAFVKGLKGH